MAGENSALVGRILIAASLLLMLLAGLYWARVLPVDPRAHGVLAAAFAVSAVADAGIGMFFLTRSRQP